MYSLSEIIFSAPAKYLQYFSRKTGFLISDFPVSFQNNVRWLWKHLSRCYDFEKQISSLNSDEEKRFYEMLHGSCYSPVKDEISDSVEQKIPWIFKHPGSGIFVPLEIIKLLMREEVFLKKNYLFALLYRLKIKEQRYFASLMGGSLEGQVALTFENNPLDMALVLYIWLINGIQKIDDIGKIIPEKGKIIHGPFTFAREITVTKMAKKEMPFNLLPSEPVPAWDYFYTHFHYLKDDIDKLYSLINRWNKGFYRSLALLKNQDSDMINALKKGILLPVITQSAKSDNKPAMKIKIASPVELQYSLNLNSVKRSNPGNII
jgi:hypothetical protein